MTPNDAAAHAGSDASKPMTDTQLDELCVNTIRTLAMDAVQRPTRAIPARPWAGAHRLRIVATRAALRSRGADLAEPRPLRALRRPRVDAAVLDPPPGRHQGGRSGLRNSGPAHVSLDDIRNFRQLGSRAAGHPEYRWTSGVETTTGPLGQGVATSVGMAIAAQWLAARYNRPGFDIFDYPFMPCAETAA